MGNNEFLSRIQIFNLVTGGNTEKADNLFESLFGESDRYDDFVAFCEKVKYDTHVKVLVFE